MLNTQRITTILAVLVAAVASVTLTAADATASAIFAENFNSKTVGTLEGQSADTGQTWGVFNLWNAGVPGLDVTTVVGQHGTKGAGSVLGETPTKGSRADFTRVLSTPTGKVTIEIDVKVGDSASQPFANGAQWWVSDSVNGRNLSLQLDNANMPGIQSQLGLDQSSHSISPALVAGVDTDLNFVGIVDLLDKKFKWKYSSIQNPNKTTSWISETYTSEWYPDSIHIFTNYPSNRDQGFDNIRIADSLLPEPATVTLLGIGGLAMLRRRRAA